MIPSLEDIGKMNPTELLRLVVSATGVLAIQGLYAKLDPIIADPALTLSSATSEADGPVPVPFGQLRGREDLGELGISVKVILTVAPLPEEFQAEPTLAIAPPTDDDVVTG